MFISIFTHDTISLKMVGLLKKTPVSPCSEQCKVSSDNSFSKLENAGNLLNVMDANGASESQCNRHDYERAEMAFSNENARTFGRVDRSMQIQQEHFKDPCSNGDTSTSKLQAATKESPAKRQRVVSIRRHRFEPFFSRDALLKNLYTRRLPPSGRNTNTSREEQRPSPLCISQPLNRPCNIARVGRTMLYRRCYNCGHCCNENFALFTGGLIPVALQRAEGSLSQSPSNGKAPGTNTYRDTSARSTQRIGRLANKKCDNASSEELQGSIKSKEKENDIKRMTVSHTRVFCSCDFGHVSGQCRQHYSNEQGIVKENLQRQESGDLHEINEQRQWPTSKCCSLPEACNVGSESSAMNRNDGHLLEEKHSLSSSVPHLDSKICQQNDQNSEEATIKGYVAESDSINEEENTEKPAYIPRKERLKCLQYSPGQFFNVSFESVSHDELKRIISGDCRNGSDTPSETEFLRGNTRESFVKELNDIFSRLAYMDEKRLEEKGVIEAIIQARAYLDRYEREMKHARSSPSRNVAASKGSRPDQKPCDNQPFSVPSSCETRQTPCYQFGGLQPITKNSNTESRFIDTTEKNTVIESSYGATDSIKASDVLRMRCEERCESKRKLDTASSTAVRKEESSNEREVESNVCDKGINSSGNKVSCKDSRKDEIDCIDDRRTATSKIQQLDPKGRKRKHEWLKEAKNFTNGERRQQGNINQKSEQKLCKWDKDSFDTQQKRHSSRDARAEATENAILASQGVIKSKCEEGNNKAKKKKSDAKLHSGCKEDVGKDSEKQIERKTELGKLGSFSTLNVIFLS